METNSLPRRSSILIVCILLTLSAGCLGLSSDTTEQNTDQPSDPAPGNQDPFDAQDAFPPREPQPRYDYERDTRQGNVTNANLGLIHGVMDPQETFDIGQDTVRLDVLVVADSDLHVALYPPDCERDVSAEVPECAHDGETTQGMVYWSLQSPPPGTWSVDMWIPQPSLDDPESNLDTVDWILYTGQLILDQNA